MVDVPPVVITFGGGRNSRTRLADININECSDGENFDLDAQQLSMRTRKAFDLVSTATNALPIRGFAQLITASGTISTLVQAGGTVYSWDGDSDPSTSVGTVNSNAKLRGPREHNYTLDDLVIITDLNKAEPVLSWDGTTLQDFAHSLTSTTLYAKFCRVHHERAFLGNITTNSTALPHMLVGSQVESATTLSVSDKPSSALGLDSPFYLLTPDLRPINALEVGFGQFLISSERGRLFSLTGSNAFDFSIAEFYQGSAVTGAEAMVNIGNDIAMGLPGRIESLSGTLNFGDVETNDLSFWISPDIEDETGWRLVYDRTRQQVFCFPDNQSACHVLHKSLLGQQISPWSKWTTTHSMSFQPTCVMALADPVTGQDAVYAGDATGNIYRLNGTSQQDAGSEDVSVSRTSKLIRIDAPGDLFEVEGWVDYRLQFTTTVTLDFLWGGQERPTQSISFTLDQSTFAVYNGSAYYGGDFFYSFKFQTEIRRKRGDWPGRGSYLRVKASWDGQAEIEEIGLVIKAT